MLQTGILKVTIKKTALRLVLALFFTCFAFSLCYIQLQSILSLLHNLQVNSKKITFCLPFLNDVCFFASNGQLPAVGKVFLPCQAQGIVVGFQAVDGILQALVALADGIELRIIDDAL